MFYCYVLRSLKTGRRYVGSCEDVEKRLNRHNAGKVAATKHGIPWTLIYNKLFSTRAEPVKRELYYKTGAGRDKFDRLEQRMAWQQRDRSPRRLAPTRFASS